MNDLQIAIDSLMDGLGRAWAAWVERCARSVDPREICYLTHVIHRGVGNRETMMLRNRVVGEWRLERDGYRTIAHATVFPTPTDKATRE